MSRFFYETPDSVRVGVWTQKKNQSIPVKNADRIPATIMLLFMHEVVYQQHLPLIRPGSLYKRNPLPVLPLRSETHLDKERHRPRAQITPRPSKENRLMTAGYRIT